MSDQNGLSNGSGKAETPAAVTAEDMDLIDSLSMEVEELLQGAESHIRNLRAYIFSLPFDHGDYVTFLNGVDVSAYLEALKGINRFVHTVKGNAGFMKLETLKSYCHRVEELTVGIMGGKLYLDRDAYAIVEQIPNVIGRFFEKIKEKYSDQDISIAQELEQIGRVRDALAKRVGNDEILLATFTKQDLGIARKSSKALKVALDLARLDGIVAEYQVAVHSVISILREANAGQERISEASKILNDHLEQLLAAAQERMVLTRYQRIVNDLGRSMGKHIDFSVTRNEALARPDVWDHCHNAMVHLVRNAVDHGIEDPSERAAQGKPPRGSISLDIWEDHKSAIIELSDDGKGIDPERVGTLAVERGILSQAELSRLSGQEVQKLIFKAGFSTKETATDVSGRGVGMDAVITEVEANLGGKLLLNSSPGKGTRLRIEIPKSETLTECVLFGDRHEAYAIPKVLEMSYLDCDLGRLESVLAKTLVYSDDSHPLKVIPVMHLLHPERYQDRDFKGYTIIRLVSESGRFGLAVPRVYGHKRMKIERKKSWRSLIGRSDLVYGYGVSDPVTVVLDIEKLEALGLED